MIHKKYKKRFRAFLTVGFFLAAAELTGCGSREADFYQEEAQEENEAEPEEEAEEEADRTVDEDASEALSTIYVYVCGAVSAPGVYELEEGSRVFQAVEAAGGFSPDAAQTYLNQARSLGDGQQIYVPTQEEAKALSAGDGEAISSAAPEAADMLTDPSDSAAENAGTNGADSTDTASGKINLNTADASQLTTLTGIGEAKARAIIAYREAHGGFASIEEIMNVEGIKEGTFSKIKDKIAAE